MSSNNYFVQFWQERQNKCDFIPLKPFHLLIKKMLVLSEDEKVTQKVDIFPEPNALFWFTKQRRNPMSHLWNAQKYVLFVCLLDLTCSYFDNWFAVSVIFQANMPFSVIIWSFHCNIRSINIHKSVKTRQLCHLRFWNMVIMIFLYFLTFTDKAAHL